MNKIILQDFTPYDQGVHWKIHKSFYCQTGVQAWTGNHIPYLSTSNYAIATQHAKFIINHISLLQSTGQLSPTNNFYILEAGGGNGAFAANFIRAFQEHDPSLCKRLRYILSDYSPKTITNTLTEPKLERFIRQGILIPALYDIFNPLQIETLKGEQISIKDIQIIITNYLCCVTPLKYLQRTEDEWEELLIQLSVSVAEDVKKLPEDYLQNLNNKNFFNEVEFDYAWQSVDMQKLFVNRQHCDVVENLEYKVFSYPYAFFDFILDVYSEANPETIVIINDYGVVKNDLLDSLEFSEPQFYGNTLNHKVNFLAIEEFAKHNNFLFFITDDPLRSLHTGVLSKHQYPARWRKWLQKKYINCQDNEDLLDFRKAARIFTEQKDYLSAAKFYKRCLNFDNKNPQFHYELGNVYLNGEYYQLAIEYLQKGLLLDSEKKYDFAFLLGMSYGMLEKHEEAIEWYELSLEFEKHPAIYTNIALVYQTLELPKKAHQYFCCALAIDKNYQRAQQELQKMEKEY